MKQAIFANVNHTQINSWNQPVASNVGKVSCSRKQQKPLLGLKLTTDNIHQLEVSHTTKLSHATPRRSNMLIRFDILTIDVVLQIVMADL